MTLDFIVRLLEREIGLDVASVGQRAIEVAVDRRAAALGVTTARYARAVHGTRLELDALIDELVVSETWFFRDVAPFTLLARRALEFTAASRLRPFRVLSVPCASGEEPYSVAIAMLDAGVASQRFEVIAYDISARNVQVARAGVYRKNSFRSPTPSLSRYIEVEGTQHRVAAITRERVRISRGNILTPGFLDDVPRFDVVLCRNLLIYLTAKARARVLDVIARVLHPDGIVIAGHAESIELFDPRFRPVAEAGSFAFTCQEAPRKPVTAPVRIPTPPPDDEPVAHVESQTLARAAELADRGELDAALLLVDRLLLTSTPTAGHYALAGVIQQVRGQLVAAERAFTQALYLDPLHLDSLVQLALLLRRRGQAAAADQLMVRATRVRGQS